MDNNSQILIYQTKAGETKVEVRLESETVWLTQKSMVELFQTTKQNISLHLQNIFQERELEEVSVVKDYLTTASDGKKYKTKFYNLDAIISVGYRIKSHIATKFRQWATQHIKEFIIKGFVLDDERLKNPDSPFNYYDELLKRIQDIRTSEKRFYQKITDIYSTSIDYDPTLDDSITFFKTVQNKLHWAITGKTAAEIIHNRADSDKENMGLTNFRGDVPRKQDISIAKNYLTEEELKFLNNLVEQYLVFAEGQAMQRIPMHMKNWIEKLNAFLNINNREILNHAGRISHNVAKSLAEKEYEKFNQKRIENEDKIDGDFEKTIKLLKTKNR